MVTRKIIRELYDYLTTGNYFPETIDSGDNNELNTTINDKWKNQIEDGLTDDFKLILTNKNLEVEQKDSRFEIVDGDAQGATIWKSFVRLTDNNEQMDVVINFIVNHDNAFIYLGTSHTNLDRYSGASEALKGLFKKLKLNEKVGQFRQTKFYELDLR